MKKKQAWRSVIAVVLLCAIVFTALAAGKTITLNSGKPMDSQIEAFKKWYNQLDFLDQADWDLAFDELTDPWNTVNKSSYSSDTTEQMVWIPRTGSKYHSTSTCSNMKNPSHVTLSEAINRDFGKCSKCW